MTGVKLSSRCLESIAKTQTRLHVKMLAQTVVDVPQFLTQYVKIRPGLEIHLVARVNINLSLRRIVRKHAVFAVEPAVEPWSQRLQSQLQVFARIFARAQNAV